MWDGGLSAWNHFTTSLWWAVEVGAGRLIVGVRTRAGGGSCWAGLHLTPRTCPFCVVALTLGLEAGVVGVHGTSPTVEAAWIVLFTVAIVVVAVGSGEACDAVTVKVETGIDTGSSVLAEGVFAEVGVLAEFTC